MNVRELIKAERRAASVDFVRSQIEENGGRAPFGVVKEAGRLLGLSRRTICRRAHRPAGQRGRRPGAYVLSTQMRALYYACNGSASKTLREAKKLKANGHLPRLVLPTSIRVLQRACAAIPTAERLLVLKGEQALRDFGQVFVPWTAPHRMHTLVADDFMSKVWIRLPGTARLFQPFITFFLDDFSRVICGFILSETAPTSERLLAGLARAILPDPDPKLNPGRGAPFNWRIDNGPNYRSDHTRNAAQGLGIGLSYCKVDDPPGKGKVERIGHTFYQYKGCELEGYNGGPRLMDGSFLQDPPMQLEVEEFCAHIEDFIAEYNNMPHSALGCTPAEKWRSDPTPVRDIPLKELASLLLPVAHRTMQKKGISMFGRRYVSQTAMLKVGEEYVVRHVPGDLSRIWLTNSAGELHEAHAVHLISERDRKRYVGTRGKQVQGLATRVDRIRLAKRDMRKLLGHTEHDRPGDHPEPGAGRAGRKTSRTPRAHRPSARTRRMAFDTKEHV